MQAAPADLYQCNNPKCNGTYAVPTDNIEGRPALRCEGCNRRWWRVYCQGCNRWIDGRKVRRKCRKCGFYICHHDGCGKCHPHCDGKLGGG